MRRPPDSITADTAPADTARRWAVVEILPDGTLGSTEVIAATTALKAAERLRRSRSPRIPADLDANLGELQAAHGHLHEAAQTLTHGMRSGRAAADPDRCAGQLALVEAFQGELGKAQAHADLALLDREHRGEHGTAQGVMHARLARAWVHLERAEHDECHRILELVPTPLGDRHPSWFAVARHLLAARLMIMTRRPDAAARQLAAAAHDPQEARTGWARGVLTAAHAEALVAAGESRRALAALTPLPPGAEVEATVAMAVGRQAIGDVRGASAVLNSVVDELEQAPLGLQMRSWILEARIADQQGRPARSHSLVERALHAASPDGLRAPLLWDWVWLRTFIERDPVLLHTYRGVLAGLHEATAASSPWAEPTPTTPGAPADAVTVALTEREVQVLELLAQMCSTDEIARALYVSANTVKTHVKGIFAKLCVNRRVDAVRRGRQLGLL